MYICKECGSVFGTPEPHKGKSECPDCGSTNFSEANYCKTCHEYFIGTCYQDYCPECVMKAEDQLISAVRKWVDDDYIEVLRDEYPDLDYLLGDREDG